MTGGNAGSPPGPVEPLEPVGRPGPADGPLHDLRVIDLATVVAGPGCARYLADFGADVLKVERPGTGDTTRSMGWTDERDDVTWWWKLAGRNKRTVVADLKDPDDLAFVRRLIDTADVLVENFRPGTLERLGLAPDDLLASNPRLVITRVTGFGQDGPYAGRPGFATLAEAMSGFAAINGEPDGAPLLPPIALTDEVTALVAAFATMVALHSGVGQVVDVNLLESLFQLMGPLMSLWQGSGVLQPRLGSGIPYSVPRGTYRCADGRWVAISTSAESVAVRVMDLIGLGDDPRYAGFPGRIANREVIDETLGAWCAARPLAEVLATFEAAHAAAAPVYDMAELAEDPHVLARDVVVDLDGTAMQGLVARLSATPGRLRWAGRPLGADTAAVRSELDQPAPVGVGMASTPSADDLAELTDRWARRWPGTRPIGADLRETEQDRWIRLHSLPGSKRYADTAAELAEVLARHNALLGHLLDRIPTRPSELLLITCGWLDPDGDRLWDLARADPCAASWQTLQTDLTDDGGGDEDDIGWTHLWVSTHPWTVGAVDAVLTLVADDRTCDVIVAPPSLDWLYHPYDGGADIIAPDRSTRDDLARRFSAWLPAPGLPTAER